MQTQSPLCGQPRGVQLGHMEIYFQFSGKPAYDFHSGHTSLHSKQKFIWFPFPHILTGIYCHLFFEDGHSEGGEWSLRIASVHILQRLRMMHTLWPFFPFGNLSVQFISSFIDQIICFLMFNLCAFLCILDINSLSDLQTELFFVCFVFSHLYGIPSHWQLFLCCVEAS